MMENNREEACANGPIMYELTQICPETDKAFTYQCTDIELLSFLKSFLDLE